MTDYSKAIYMSPKDVHFPVIYELLCMFAMYKNNHVWYNLKDIPLETRLNDLDAIENILQTYFDEQT